MRIRSRRSSSSLSVSGDCSSLAPMPRASGLTSVRNARTPARTSAAPNAPRPARGTTGPGRPVVGAEEDRRPQGRGRDALTARALAPAGGGQHGPTPSRPSTPVGQVTMQWPRTRGRGQLSVNPIAVGGAGRGLAAAVARMAYGRSCRSLRPNSPARPGSAPVPRRGGCRMPPAARDQAHASDPWTATGTATPAGWGHPAPGRVRSPAVRRGHGVGAHGLASHATSGLASLAAAYPRRLTPGSCDVAVMADRWGLPVAARQLGGMAPPGAGAPVPSCPHAA